jgi:hypothetical protein
MAEPQKRANENFSQDCGWDLSALLSVWLFIVGHAFSLDCRIFHNDYRVNLMIVEYRSWIIRRRLFRMFCFLSTFWALGTLFSIVLFVTYGFRSCWSGSLCRSAVG